MQKYFLLLKKNQPHPWKDCWDQGCLAQVQCSSRVAKVSAGGLPAAATHLHTRHTGDTQETHTRERQHKAASTHTKRTGATPGTPHSHMDRGGPPPPPRKATAASGGARPGRQPGKTHTRTHTHARDRDEGPRTRERPELHKAPKAQWPRRKGEAAQGRINTHTGQGPPSAPTIATRTAEGRHPHPGKPQTPIREASSINLDIRNELHVEAVWPHRTGAEKERRASNQFPLACNSLQFAPPRRPKLLDHTQDIGMFACRRWNGECCVTAAWLGLYNEQIETASATKAMRREKNTFTKVCSNSSSTRGLFFLSIAGQHPLRHEQSPSLLL